MFRHTGHSILYATGRACLLMSVMTSKAFQQTTDLRQRNLLWLLLSATYKERFEGHMVGCIPGDQALLDELGRVRVRGDEQRVQGIRLGQGQGQEAQAAQPHGQQGSHGLHHQPPHPQGPQL